ncbi:MAG: lantipeptide synthetase [Comamonadaceae bacterium]|nr:MAG: lantipeptide synthetase [Comamonadaceae bacterium]
MARQLSEGGDVKPAYPTFATTHPVFYDQRRTDSSRPFTVSEAADWDDWDQVADVHWTHWLRADRPLPEQGWKIHVSARPDNAAGILLTVSQYCHQHRISFKHVRSAGRLDVVVAKDCERAVAGKFITIYPRTHQELRDALLEVDRAIGGTPGPYILSDLRWENGPLFVRYGAFHRQFVTDGGNLVPAIRNLSTGELVPDVRDVAFSVPDWVTVPSFISDQQARLDTSPPPGLPAISRALHYSNAGGVYEATDDGQPVVVKEARPHAGWTPDGRDAVTRLDHEERTLRLLTGHRVPQVRRTVMAYGHRYLTLSQVPGVPLPALIATTHPLTVDPVDRAAASIYRDWALTVAGDLRALVAAVHASGVTHGDLHPANVIVDGETVHLIDFEMSVSTGSASDAVLGAPGFIPPDRRSPVDRDLYAVACIELHMFYPLIPLLNLDEDAPDRVVRAAQHAFELDDEWADRLLRVLRRRARVTRPRPEPPVALDALIQAIAEQLHRDATGDEERLWPGDPRQFDQPSVSVAHGAAGVAVSLAEAGVTLRPELVEWIRTHHRSSRLGLMDGAAGAALACRRLRMHTEAELLTEQVRSSDIPLGDASLYSGAAGIGLFILDADADEQRAATIATDLHRRWSVSPPRRVATDRGGLLRGASGSALLAIRLFERTGDSSFLAMAETALDYDIAYLTPGRDGSLHVNEGWRAQPYLAYGSAGIGSVLLEYLCHRPDHHRYQATVLKIIRAASARFTVQSGLFHGRAGLVHFLVHAQRVLGPTESRCAAIARHIEGLRPHMLPSLRLTGDSLIRASCDLATGSAGVLSALVAVRAFRNGDPASVPPIPYLLPTAPRERR